MHEYAEITSRRHTYTNTMLCKLFFSVKNHIIGSVFWIRNVKMIWTGPLWVDVPAVRSFMSVSSLCVWFLKIFLHVCIFQTHHLTMVKMRCPLTGCLRATRRRWTPCTSTTACCTRVQEIEPSKPLTWWWVVNEITAAICPGCAWISIMEQRCNFAFLKFCRRVINVWVRSRVTAPKWAACWSQRLQVCIIAFILVPVTRSYAATASG